MALQPLDPLLEKLSELGSAVLEKLSERQRWLVKSKALYRNIPNFDLWILFWLPVQTRVIQTHETHESSVSPGSCPVIPWWIPIATQSLTILNKVDEICGMVLNGMEFLRWPWGIYTYSILHLRFISQFTCASAVQLHFCSWLLQLAFTVGFCSWLMQLAFDNSIWFYSIKDIEILYSRT